jgi:hypothetical protein
MQAFLSDGVLMFKFFLAGNAALGFRRGVQPRSPDINATLCAFPIIPGINALQRRINGVELGGFMLGYGEFGFPFGSHLCPRIFRTLEMRDRSICTAHDTAALLCNLGQQRSTHGLQLLAVRIGLVFVHTLISFYQQFDHALYSGILL